MAEKRMINKSISISEQVNDLPSLFDKLLFTWMIPHTDDFGRMPGSPAKVRGLVVPLMDDVTVADVEESLHNIASERLIQWYEADGQKYIQFPNFDKHQTGLHKRTRSKFPEPPDDSGNFPEILGQQKGREQNLIEQNRTEEKGRELSGIPLDPLPPKSNPHQDRILNLINECKVTDVSIYSLEQIYAYVGVVDIEVIETAIKKASGKHINYAVNTIAGMKKEGITRKEQVQPKIPETGTPTKTARKYGNQQTRPTLTVHTSNAPEATQEDIERMKGLVERLKQA